MSALARARDEAEQRLSEWARRYSVLDVDGLLDLYVDECEYEDVILGHVFSGKAELRLFVEFIRDRVSDLRVDATRTIVANDGAALEVTWHTNGGEEKGGTSLRGVTLFARAADGRFRRSSDYWNAAALIRARGHDAVEALASELSERLRLAR